VKPVGIDHVYLTVSDFARAERFYDDVMEMLGFRKGDKPIGGDPHAHYFNPNLQVSIRPARSRTAHDPYAPGLHHLCLQAATRADVDRIAAALRARGVEATEPALYPEYDAEYYATFFEDPDGLRLEVVARTSSRDEIVARWDELRVFVNPMAELRAREPAGAGNGPPPPPLPSRPVAPVKPLAPGTPGAGLRFGRVALVWLVLAVSMIVLGTARELLIAPTVGSLRAHQIGSVFAAVIVILGSAVSLKWLGAVQDVPIQIRIGGIWLGMTVAFEFVFGHYVVGHDWAALLADYDVTEGRLWSLVLIATFLGPFIAGRFVGPRPPP
jgi:catechol 2,3-dioxygenase-like lactoylglutathione lyase family enzyme